jgi:hypothetical protein
MVTLPRSFMLALAALLASGGACRDPEELLETVNAVVLVVGADDRDIVTIAVGGETRRASPDEDGVIEFKLALPEGSYTGTVRVERNDNDDDDDARCGAFSLTVVEGAVDSAGVIADDLEKCEDDDDDDVIDDDDIIDDDIIDDDVGEGEGDTGEGEGEVDDSGEGEGEGDVDDSGEGEGEVDDGGEGEGDPDGEGEGDPDGEGEGEGE